MHEFNLVVTESHFGALIIDMVDWLMVLQSVQFRYFGLVHRGMEITFIIGCECDVTLVWTNKQDTISNGCNFISFFDRNTLTIFVTRKHIRNVHSRCDECL